MPPEDELEWEGCVTDDDYEETDVLAEHVDALGDIMMGLAVDLSGANNDDVDDVDFHAPVTVDSMTEIECREVLEEAVSDGTALQSAVVDALAAINIVRNVNFA